MFIVEYPHSPLWIHEFIRLSALHIYRVKSVNKRNIERRKKQQACYVQSKKNLPSDNRPVLYTFLVRISTRETCLEKRKEKRKRLYHFRAGYRKV